MSPYDEALANINISVNEQFLWIAFFVGLFVFASSCLVFLYHWKSYGTKEGVVGTASVLYMVVGAILLALTAFFISIH